MIAAKDALAQGLERLAAGAPDGGEFVSACVDYLEFVVGRFIRQGRANIARLRGVVPETEADDRRVLDDIEAALAATSEQLDRMTAARGGAGFADAGRSFLRFYDGTLAQRKNRAQDIVDKYIDTTTYWRETDDVTEESIAEEQALFARLTALAPDIAAPAND